MLPLSLPCAHPPEHGGPAPSVATQFMRYAVLHNYSYVHLCSTHDQFADGLTKVTVTQQWLEMHNIMLNL